MPNMPGHYVNRTAPSRPASPAASNAQPFVALPQNPAVGYQAQDTLEPIRPRARWGGSAVTFHRTASLDYWTGIPQAVEFMGQLPDMFEAWAHDPDPFAYWPARPELLRLDMLGTTHLTEAERQDSICCITREPLADLVCPVAVRANAAVHVFEWEALTFWWRTHPNENPLTRRRLSQTELFRII